MISRMSGCMMAVSLIFLKVKVEMEVVRRNGSSLLMNGEGSG